MKTKIILFGIGFLTAVNLLPQNPGQDYTDRSIAVNKGWNVSD